MEDGTPGDRTPSHGALSAIMACSSSANIGGGVRCEDIGRFQLRCFFFATGWASIRADGASWYRIAYVVHRASAAQRRARGQTSECRRRSAVHRSWHVVTLVVSTAVRVTMPSAPLSSNAARAPQRASPSIQLRRGPSASCTTAASTLLGARPHPTSRPLSRTLKSCARQGASHK